ncbi:MAG: hypothetical protein LBD47_06845 [Treponema sp.]|jgi:hypothetical protein|nr:hypothetical protein [Treponema sp.]
MASVTSSPARAKSSCEEYTLIETAKGNGWNSYKYEREGIDRVLNRKVRYTPPVPPIVTGEVQAKIIARCCGEPPEGYSRWTLRLLGSTAVELGIVAHI